MLDSANGMYFLANDERNINRKKTLNKKKSNFQIRLEEAMKAKQKNKRREKILNTRRYLSLGL